MFRKTPEYTWEKGNYSAHCSEHGKYQRITKEVNGPGHESYLVRGCPACKAEKSAESKA